jgi:diguanylate cyclase (GGDEF)-like protein
MPDLDPDFIGKLSRLGLIALLLAVVIVVAARFRQFWGLTPIAVLVGLFQMLQTTLAIGLRIQVFPGVELSAGSVAIFPATLFAVLLVYVIEDEAEARRLVYAAVLANVLVALLIVFGQPLFNSPGEGNRLGLDPPAAARLARIVVTGALLLAVDAFILIRAFEWFASRIGRNILARAQFALGLSIAFDAVAFSVVVFGASPRLGSILLIDMAGKLLAATFYSLAFLFLLPWSRVSGISTTDSSPSSPIPVTYTGPITYKDRFEDLRKSAVRDALTGVFNRAYFDHDLEIQTRRALLRGDRLVLLLIDLDSFKKVNDTYGHPAGDRVLVLFGEALRAVARQNDTACRYGGEEFAMLIAGGTLSIAARLFERTTEELARLWAAASPPLPFPACRFSVGAAAVPDDARTAEDLLAVADRRLYASKRAGGDRLTVNS